MEVKGLFVHHAEFRPSHINWVLARKTQRLPVLVSLLRDSSPTSPLRVSFPVSYRKRSTIEDKCSDISRSARQSFVSPSDSSRVPELNLNFGRSQLRDQDSLGVQKRAFGQFVTRGAVLDEEYWTAASLRAEAHWESVSYMRHVDSYKRKYAEQEFYALKRRCSGRDGNLLKCFCIVTVKEETDVRRTTSNSVVGTLDLSIRQFLQGETFPGELKRHFAVLASHEACDAHRYAYIANVCVSKCSRRQGIASNMLHLASDLASASGMKQLFVHVNADNKAAQELYRKIGFEVKRDLSQLNWLESLQYVGGMSSLNPVPNEPNLGWTILKEISVGDEESRERGFDRV